MNEFWFGIYKRQAQMVNRGSNLISKEEFQFRLNYMFMKGIFTPEEYDELLALVTPEAPAEETNI